MSTYEIALVLGMTAVTFGVRYPVLALVSRLQLAPSIERALRYIPPAVLAAIIAPEILLPDGENLALRLDNSALVGGIVASIIAWRTRNLLLTIVIGMGSFWLWRWVVGMF